MGKLKILEKSGFPFYFQFTLTPYGRQWERSLPPKREIVETFRRLSRSIGPERVVWRYDPVICTPELTPEWHLTQFEQLCSALKGCTQECIFSFVDLYAKARRGSRGLGLSRVSGDKMEQISAGFSRIATRYGICLRTCCEKNRFLKYGIRDGACIDAERIRAVTGRPLRLPKDRGQRPFCNCAASVDIGAYDTCRNGCVYCYATGSAKAAARHDPDSPLLTGEPPR